VLEGLGWSIVRTWSTDWYFDPVREAEKLDAKLRGLLEQDRTRNPAEFSAGQATEPTEAEEAVEHASGRRGQRHASGEWQLFTGSWLERASSAGNEHAHVIGFGRFGRSCRTPAK
jgi:hypothetical protein